MEYKALEIKDQSVDMDQRIIEGYASTKDLDQGGDIIHPGSFSKTISERFPAGKVKVLRNHSTLIGVPLEMREDGKGLWTKSRISKTQAGDETLELARDGALSAMSIGYAIPSGKSEEKDGIRHIKEVKLFEYSMVDFPMNESAIITGVKQIERAIKNGGKCDNPAELLEAIKSLQALITGQAKPQDDATESLRKSLAEFRAMIKKM